MKIITTLLALLWAICCLGQMQKDVVDSLFFGKNGLRATAPEVGVVIGIFSKGQTHYYSTGTRTATGAELVDSTTIFEAGSATKTLTGLLLAIQMQKGKVGPNDYIDKYLPYGIVLPDGYRNKVKLTDLASHQSGLPNLSSDKYFRSLMKRDPNNPFRFVDTKYLYDVLKATYTLTGFGTYQYNNYAFSLLGDLLGRNDASSYSSMATGEILHPLKMINSTFGNVHSSNVAGLYDQRSHVQAKMILGAATPAGGLKTNAVDIIRYLKAQLDPPADLRNAIILTQTAYYDDGKRKVGLGWDIMQNFYQKDGDTFGNSCLLRFNVKENVAIVVLSNHQNGKLVSDMMDFIYRGLVK